MHQVLKLVVEEVPVCCALEETVPLAPIVVPPRGSSPLGRP
jgi:hypothetical protein